MAFPVGQKCILGQGGSVVSREKAPEPRRADWTNPWNCPWRAQEEIFVCSRLHVIFHTRGKFLYP